MHQQTLSSAEVTTFAPSTDATSTDSNEDDSWLFWNSWFSVTIVASLWMLVIGGILLCSRFCKDSRRRARNACCSCCGDRHESQVAPDDNQSDSSDYLASYRRPPPSYGRAVDMPRPSVFTIFGDPPPAYQESDENEEVHVNPAFADDEITADPKPRSKERWFALPRALRRMRHRDSANQNSVIEMEPAAHSDTSGGSPGNDVRNSSDASVTPGDSPSTATDPNAQNDGHNHDLTNDDRSRGISETGNHGDADDTIESSFTVVIEPGSVDPERGSMRSDTFKDDDSELPTYTEALEMLGDLETAGWM